MPDWWRKIPHPGYGVCGGRTKDCVPVNRAMLGPVDRLFYDHDNDLAMSKGSRGRTQADVKLHMGLKALTEKDFKQIPFFIWKPPFFKRWYARQYVKAALAVFERGEE